MLTAHGQRASRTLAPSPATDPQLPLSLRATPRLYGRAWGLLELRARALQSSGHLPTPTYTPYDANFGHGLQDLMMPTYYASEADAGVIMYWAGWQKLQEH